MVALWFSLYGNIFPTYCCKREKYWESKALLFLMVLFMTPLLVTYTTTTRSVILLLPVAATLLLLCYYPIGKRRKEGRKEVEVTKKKEREIGPAIKSLNYYSIREIEHTIDRLLQNMERGYTS